MTSSFYKLKRHRLVSGVLAGLADKFGLSVTPYASCLFFSRFLMPLSVWIIYLLLDTTLPYKDEEEQEIFDDGPRPRRRKEAEPIHDQNDSPFF